MYKESIKIGNFLWKRKINVWNCSSAAALMGKEGGERKFLFSSPKQYFGFSVLSIWTKNRPILVRLSTEPELKYPNPFQHQTEVFTSGRFRFFLGYGSGCPALPKFIYITILNNISRGVITKSSLHHCYIRRTQNKTKAMTMRKHKFNEKTP